MKSRFVYVSAVLGMLIVAAQGCGEGDSQSTTASTGSGSPSGTTSGGGMDGTGGTGGQGGSVSQGGGGTGGVGGMGGQGGGSSGGAAVNGCGSNDPCEISEQQICCFNPNAMPPDPKLSCTAPGKCEVTVTCDGPEDCSGGSVCCQNGGTIGCDPTCAMGNTICHTIADCPNAADYKCIQVSGGFISACEKNMP